MEIAEFWLKLGNSGEIPSTEQEFPIIRRNSAPFHGHKLDIMEWTQSGHAELMDTNWTMELVDTKWTLRNALL